MVEQDDATVLSGIAEAFEAAAPSGVGLRTTVAQLIRQAIDEVIDAPRTGRLVLSECEKTEKTYLGTKIEILLRSALRLPKGKVLDLLVNGREVDIKHTIGRSWMIPREAIGQVCLLISENERLATYKLGLAVCRPENLRTSANRDGKLSLSAVGLNRVRWMAFDERYPPNIWQRMPVEVLETIRFARRGTPRVAALFRCFQRRPIPRSAITAVAPQLDPLKRVRANGGARDVLRPEGIAILWGKYDRALIAELRLGPLYPDEFISVSPETADERRLLVAANHLD